MSIYTIFLASLWRLTRKPDGKITRTVANLQTSAEEFTKRLEDPRFRPDMSLHAQAVRESVGRTCHSIQFHIERIRLVAGTLDVMLDQVERVAGELTAVLDRMEEEEREAAATSQ